MRNTKVKKVRLNLSLPKGVRRRLEEMQAETGATTMTEVIKKSLALYNLVLLQRKKGAKILIQDYGSFKTREMVFVEEITQFPFDEKKQLLV